jgi:large subunit ribosomal protein L29
MKKKDIQEMKNKSVPELQKLVTDGTERLRALRFDLAAGKVKNVAELREVRKSIARAKTFLHERAATASQ